MREREKENETERERERGRKREKERERMRQRQTESERDRQTDSETRERETVQYKTHLNLGDIDHSIGRFLTHDLFDATDAIRFWTFIIASLHIFRFSVDFWVNVFVHLKFVITSFLY